MDVPPRHPRKLPKSIGGECEQVLSDGVKDDDRSYNDGNLPVIVIQGISAAVAQWENNGRFPTMGQYFEAKS